MFQKSAQLFGRAQKLFPGGVNSPVRAFKAVGHTPVFMQSATGAYLYDVDGNKYIDYIGSWGPMICGHTHPKVVEAIQKAATQAISFGASSDAEIRLGELVTRMVPSIQIVRFVTSGTEACMAAVRLARAFTGRPKIVKFAGCYHGHYDSFLVQAGSGVATLGLPDSPGVLPELASQTLTVPYNDLEALKNCFEANPGQIAALIVEPVVGNAGCILPQPGYLQSLRKMCDEYEALLIFDEVMTGFRLAPGGAQERFGVKPDLTTLGKIIGGGLPVGAYGGRADIMAMVAPAGPMYQAGTLAGNPIAMAAGEATLNLARQEGFYEGLEQTGQELENGINELTQKHKIPAVLNRCGAMLSVFFTEAKHVTDYGSAQTSDRRRFAKFFGCMLKNGVYLPPSQFEAWFFSGEHKSSEVHKTLKAIDLSLSDLNKEL
jgi:glutamate-1-semialdehyde 2,1-aminomutase